MTSDLCPYPEYKESGLPWLGKVPTHWDVHRAKYLFRCIDVRSTTGFEELLSVSAERGGRASEFHEGNNVQSRVLYWSQALLAE